METNMFRNAFFLLLFLELALVRGISLGRLFPASRHRSRAASVLGQAIDSSFYKKPQPPPVRKTSKNTAPKVSLNSLPSFDDVVWKINKNFLKEEPNNNEIVRAKPKKNKTQNLITLFSRIGDVYSSMAKSKFNQDLKEKLPPTTTPAPQYSRRVSSVTNSPIFYIKLPAVPYEYHPDLGYISRPPSPDFANFLRPEVDFFNNGKPSKIYEPTENPEESTTQEATTEITTQPPTTTEEPTTTIKTTTQSTKFKGFTNSPITWLKGPFKFNGRPGNMFIFNSPKSKADRFDYLHKIYSKPGTYL